MKRGRTHLVAVEAVFGHARLATALSTACVGIGVFTFATHRIIGWPGLNAILGTLILLSALSLWARRDSINWTGVVPISLVAFVGWCAASIFWSQYQWASLGGVAYLIGFTTLGLYVALVRDTIQIIRAFGDVVRFALLVSLALEIFSGLLIDAPIGFLSISGRLDELGPISGVLGTRNDLGLLAVIGGISFAIEWRTRAVARGVAVGSLGLAGITLALTGSPVAWGTAFVAIAVTAVLFGVRKLAPERREFWQYALLVAAATALALAWVFRSALVSALNGGGELAYRLTLWREIWSLVPLHPVEGWGWIGQWNADVSPYVQFGAGSGRPNTSAANAFLDVWFQLGVIGVGVFAGVLGLAFVRSWLLAARKRSVVFTWPAIVLAALITASLAESTILIEFGWFTFVVCCVKASQTLSWRSAFARPLEQERL